MSDIPDKYIAVVNYSEKYSILCYCNSRTGSQNIKGGQVLMVLAYYVSMCALSLVCCTIYFFIKRKYFPFRYATVFILAFLSQFCYVLLAVSKDVREALIIYKFLYIGGCFLPLAGLFMILSVCKIELPKWVRFILILLSAATYCLVLSAGYSPLFYKSVDIEFKNGVTVLVKDYGPLHILFYIEIGIFLVLTVFAIVYGWIEKPNASRKNLVMGSFLEITAIIAFFVGRIFTKDIEWMALADLIMTYEMKRRTLLMIHNEGFSTANYLHFKAKAALEAIEESSGKQKRKGKRQINKSDIRYPELYKRLIVWREKKATMYETNANNIIQYRALVNIVNEVPTTLPSLMAVQYVGRTTVKKYGMDILEIVNTFVNQNRDNLS